MSDPTIPASFPPPWASAFGEDDQGLWAEFQIGQVSQIFRWIEPGSFLMGSPENEEGRFSDEDQHEVTLTNGFWLADTTVTQAFWQEVTDDDPSEFKGEQRPVEMISWRDVHDFIERLNKSAPDLQARFPTEAEWEYACRAGTTGAFNFAGELSLEKVNYRGIWNLTMDNIDEWNASAKKRTVNVKSYPPNQWGLYEMHGNVWEWCEDVWQSNLGREAVADPQQVAEPQSDASRVVRGGSWGYDGGDVRSACRHHFSPDGRYYNLGFRLALGH